MFRRTALQLLLGGAAALPMTAVLAGQARASSNDGGSSGDNDSSSSGSSSGNDSRSSGSFGGNDNSSSGSFGRNDDGTSGSFSGSSPNSPSGPDDTLSGSSSDDDLLRLQQTQNIEQSLNDDGLEPVSMDNLANVLADFQ
ncbi:hypothetical protein HKCCD6035_11120 [Rhodobacterales bacterium HKCCD6035]|nr:hypothetical protein [Rhodobacterales bacterium HKCCD6035]